MAPYNAIATFGPQNLEIHEGFGPSEYGFLLVVPKNEGNVASHDTPGTSGTTWHPWHPPKKNVQDLLEKVPIAAKSCDEWVKSEIFVDL